MPERATPKRTTPRTRSQRSSEIPGCSQRTNDNHPFVLLRSANTHRRHRSGLVPFCLFFQFLFHPNIAAGAREVHFSSFFASLFRVFYSFVFVCNYFFSWFTHACACMKTTGAYVCAWKWCQKSSPYRQRGKRTQPTRRETGKRKFAVRNCRGNNPACCSIAKAIP